MGETNAKGRTAYTTRRCRQMDAALHSPLFQDHRRGRRLSAGASPCRRIPRGGAVPSQACSIWGASSTRVAAKAFCVATDIMLHHRFSHANEAFLDRSPLRAGAHSEAGLHSTAEGHSTVALRNPKTLYSKWLQREPEEHDGGEVLEHHVVCASAAASRWARRQTLLRSSGSSS